MASGKKGGKKMVAKTSKTAIRRPKRKIKGKKTRQERDADIESEVTVNGSEPNPVYYEF